MSEIERAKKYIKDQFDGYGDSPWLEGWIYGYTDMDHVGSSGMRDDVREGLLLYLKDLRKGSQPCP